MKNKHIVVVGASAGLGKAFALQAGNDGARVALVARRKELLEKLSEEISSNGGEGLVLPCDIRSVEQIEKTFTSIRDEWGQIDIALNAAGVVDPLSAVVDTLPDDFRRALEINVLGLFLCCREELRIARDQKTPATIINVSSGAANKAYLNWAAYSCSKAAVDTITRIAAAEHESSPIRVFAVSPGPFESHMQETMRSSSEEDFPARDKFIRLHEEGLLPSAEEVSAATLGLASCDWPELSGEIIELRGEDFRRKAKERGIVIDY